MKITFKKERGQLIPYSDEDYEQLSKLSDAVYQVDVKNMDMRTIKQNSAMHKYFQLLADALNNHGLTVSNMMKVDIDWNEGRVKENLWRPIQEAILDKKSTTKLSSNEVSIIYDTLNRALSVKFGISVQFPSIDK